MGNEQNVNRRNTRREFLRGAAGTAAALGALPLLGASGVEALAAGSKPAGKKMSKVCMVRTDRALSAADDMRDILGAMLDEGIKYISGSDDPQQFWNGNFGPGDTVAFKPSAVIDRYMNFGPQLAGLVNARIMKAGVAPESITLYERETKSLKRAGYTINKDGPGVRCYGNNDGGYSDRQVVSGEVKCHFCNTLENSTALVNMPLLKTHSLSGITNAMKNHYGSFDKPWEYHASGCDPFIADINAAPPVRDKHRLVVCDAMNVLYAGGPQYAEEYTRRFNAIIVGVDPVAVDAIGYMILRKIRKQSDKDPLPYLAKPVHIDTAAERGIGTNDKKGIDFKSITV